MKHDITEDLEKIREHFDALIGSAETDESVKEELCSMREKLSTTLGQNLSANIKTFGSVYLCEDMDLFYVRGFKGEYKPIVDCGRELRKKPLDVSNEKNLIGYNGKRFFLSDTAIGYELKWLPIGDMLVCDRNILVGISWETLSNKGFVSGEKEITIDDKQYRIFLPKDHIWDAFVKMYKGEIDIHDENIGSWCENSDEKHPEIKHVRGGMNENMASYIGEIGAKRSPYIGWRPVLKQL